MGLFGEKPFYKHKMLEKVNVDIDAVIRQERINNITSEAIKCRKIAETSDYEVFQYFHTEKKETYNSQSYFLRRDKRSPYRVVYLGKNYRTISAVYCGFIFQTTTTVGASRAWKWDYYIQTTNINTGEIKLQQWTSNVSTYFEELFTAGFGGDMINPFRPRDEVRKMWIEDGLLKIGVVRDKIRDADGIRNNAPINKYDCDTHYIIAVSYATGALAIKYYFPVGETEQYYEVPDYMVLPECFRID